MWPAGLQSAAGSEPELGLSSVGAAGSDSVHGNDRATVTLGQETPHRQSPGSVLSESCFRQARGLSSHPFKGTSRCHNIRNQNTELVYTSVEI